MRSRQLMFSRRLVGFRFVSLSPSPLRTSAFAVCSLVWREQSPRLWLANRCSGAAGWRAFHGSKAGGCLPGLLCVRYLGRLSQCVEWIIAGYGIRQTLKGALKLRPRVPALVTRQLSVELGKSSGVSQCHHHRGNLIETVPQAHQPGKKCHAAPDAIGVLVRWVRLVDEVRFAILHPLRSRREIRQRIVADDRGAPARERFAGAQAAEVSVHRTLAQFRLKQRGDSR